LQSPLQITASGMTRSLVLSEAATCDRARNLLISRL